MIALKPADQQPRPPTVRELMVSGPTRNTSVTDAEREKWGAEYKSPYFLDGLVDEPTDERARLRVGRRVRDSAVEAFDWDLADVLNPILATFHLPTIPSHF